jgi:GH15 family glucan-1,4-alpha-glucosidase
MFERLVRPATDFMFEYRDPDSALPLPSYDLWEERRGVHTYTVATVAKAFLSASKMAQVVGDEARANRYKTAAEEAAAALRRHLFDEDRGVFYRRLVPEKIGYITDPTIDSSTLHVGLLGILPITDEAMASTIRRVEETLWVEGSVGGLARYEGDWYWKVSEEHPGNPWVITTMWLAQCRIIAARSLEELQSAERLLDWARSHANPSGVLPEQFHAATGEHLSVSPLTWSHAEVIKTGLEYCRKHAELS